MTAAPCLFAARLGEDAFAPHASILPAIEGAHSWVYQKTRRSLLPTMSFCSSCNGRVDASSRWKRPVTRRSFGVPVRLRVITVAAWLRDPALRQPPQPRPKSRHRVTQDAKVVAAPSRYRSRHSGHLTRSSSAGSAASPLKRGVRHHATVTKAGMRARRAL